MWYGDKFKLVGTLSNFLHSKKINIQNVVVAMFSSMQIHNDIFAKSEDVKIIQELEELLVFTTFNLLKREDVLWKPKLINGLANHPLSWKNRYEDVLNYIYSGDEDLWANVIERSPCTNESDIWSFVDMLIEILESNKDISLKMQTSCKKRLYQIINEKDPNFIDEKALNLPLNYY